MKTKFFDKLKQLGIAQTQQTLNLQGFKLSKKYIIFDLIARGSNSLIFYAIQQQSKQERILKLYNFKQIQQQSSFYHKQIIKRLSNYEISFMLKCRSMHILKTYDVYEDNNCKMIVSQYCNMGSLKQEILRRKHKIINEMRAIIILKQILIGLKNLHKTCKKMHKNLKSENILIKNGVYKLIDFGLPTSVSQVRNPDDQNFRIPQLMIKRSYDEKAEVWNVGVLFYQILFGQLPQIIVNRYKSLMNINTHESIYNRKDDAWISTQTRNFLLSCLYISPDYRLTWQQLENHDMFHLVTINIQQQQPKTSPKPLNPSQLQKPIRLASQIMIDEQILSQQFEALSSISQSQQKDKLNIQNFVSVDEQFYKEKRHLEVQKKEIQKQLDKPYEKMGKDYQLSKLIQASQRYFRQKINKDQFKYYKSLRQYYNDCLKVQFILEQLINPIKIIHESPRYKQQKQIIQFMYLLLSRCFTALSLINQFNLKKNQNRFNNMMLLYIKEKTKNLYETVRVSWNDISKMLTQQENKLANQLFDYFKKKLSKDKYIQEEIYFCGIESIDYKREDQIKYTKSYFKQKIFSIIQDLKQQAIYKSSLSPDKNGRNSQKNKFCLKYQPIQRYMLFYDKIWNIQQNISQNYCFIKDYIYEEILGIQN